MVSTRLRNRAVAALVVMVSVWLGLVYVVLPVVSSASDRRLHPVTEDTILSEEIHHRVGVAGKDNGSGARDHSGSNQPLHRRGAPSNAGYHHVPDDTAPRTSVVTEPVFRNRPASPACNNKLYTPTFVTYSKELGVFILVDCWHHRILQSADIDAPIPSWSDFAMGSVVEAGNESLRRQGMRSLSALRIPHSVASNGEIVVTESSVGGSNGDNHSVLVFRLVRDATGATVLAYHSEVLACDNNRARRPHRIIYDQASASFFLYLTSPAHLSRFVWNRATQTLERKACQGLPFMRGMYARSILAVNDSLYITAGPGVIWRTSLDPGTGLVVKRQAYPIKPLGFVKGKMNDLAFIDGWWYATSTVPCAMVRFRSVERMWEHEKIHTKLGLCGSFSRKAERCLGGTPYFVSKIGERIFVPYIFGCSGVVSFLVNAVTGFIEDVQQHWSGGWVEDNGDLSCRGTEW